MRTLIITAVALGLGLLSSPTFAHGSSVDPDPAGIGTYLVSAVLLASCASRKACCVACR
jgi:hypothetical protein